MLCVLAIVKETILSAIGTERGEKSASASALVIKRSRAHSHTRFFFAVQRMVDGHDMV